MTLGMYSGQLRAIAVKDKLVDETPSYRKPGPATLSCTIFARL